VIAKVCHEAINNHLYQGVDNNIQDTPKGILEEGHNNPIDFYQL